MSKFNFVIPVVLSSFIYLNSNSALAIDLAQSFNFEGVLLNDGTDTPMAGPVNLTLQIFIGKWFYKSANLFITNRPLKKNFIMGYVRLSCDLLFFLSRN